VGAAVVAYDSNAVIANTKKCGLLLDHLFASIAIIAALSTPFLVSMSFHIGTPKHPDRRA